MTIPPDSHPDPASVPDPLSGTDSGPYSGPYSDRFPAALPFPIVAAEGSDREAIDELLRLSGLPALNGAGAATTFAIVRQGDGSMIGCAGCERRGNVAVLHSVVVTSRAKACGVGTALVMNTLRRLVGAGVQMVALQAVGGQGFFNRFGFLKAPVGNLPPEVRENWRFDDADPTVSTPMLLDVRAATLVVPASRADMPAVLAIYNDAVAQSTATYDYEPRTLDEQLIQFDQRMQDGYGFYVAKTADGTVAGFSTYGLYRPRPGWRFACEHSVYVAAPWRGMRVGLGLLPPIMRHARKRGFHTMIGVVDAENQASIGMHDRAGFEVVGTLRQGGYKFDRWLDVAFLQAML